MKSSNEQSNYSSPSPDLNEGKKITMVIPPMPERNMEANAIMGEDVQLETEGYEDRFNEELKHIPVPNLIKKTGFEKIMEVSSLLVRQKSEAKEILTGCETNIVYYISSSITESANPGKKLFKAKEYSTCFQTHMMKQECRPLEMHVSNIVNSESSEDKPFLAITKETTGTCLKWKRPQVSVADRERKGNESLGELRSNYEGLCGRYSLEVRNASGIKYIIKTSGMQWSFCCPLPCKQCEKVYFDVLNPKSDESEPAKVVGIIVKNLVCCKKTVLTDNEYLMLIFPRDSTKEDRALLLAALLYIEFTLFPVSSPGINS